MAGTGSIFDRTPDNTRFRNSIALFQRADDRFAGSVDWLPCARCLARERNEYDRSCYCVLRGARGFYLKVGSRVVCPFLATGNTHRCTGQLEPARRNSEHTRTLRQDIPCSLVVGESVDELNLCSVHCIRAGCHQHVARPMNINAKYLLNKAHTVIYVLPTLLRAALNAGP